MSTSSSPSRVARDERGYTLIELLMGLVLSLVVAAAAFTILDVSMHLTSRITDRVDATQLGRNAMDKVVQELHSACVARGVTPIKTATSGIGSSDDKNLIFASQFGPQATLLPNLHRITFTSPSPAGAANGTLTDTTYPLASGTTPANWVFSLSSTTTTIIKNVSQAAVNGTVLPVFQYYAYSGPRLSSVPLGVPLTVADAATAAQVTVSFATSPSTVAASGGSSVNSRLDRTVNLTDSVVFRVSPADPSLANVPCG